MNTSKSPRRIYLLMITFVSAMGGLLFGYDWVVIGGAKPFYEVFFDIADRPAMQGFVMASAILGCIGGVAVSGMLADRYGRKPLLLVSSVVFIASAYGTGACNSLDWFIFYRLLGGIGIGIASTLSPMYIAEVSPSAQRGRYVSINQLTIVLGILAAQLVNWFVAEDVMPGQDIVHSWNVAMGWRWMFWAELVPAMSFLLLIFFIPESPRWLAVKGHQGRAERIFTTIGGSQYAREELGSVQGNMRNTVPVKLRDLLRGRLSKVVLTGVVIAVFQQWCGLNVVFNYAQEIFNAAGYGITDILFNIVVTGLTNVVFTFVGMFMVDRWGRKALMLFGASSLAIIYALLGLCYYTGYTGMPVLVLVVLAIAAYAMSLAPVTWVVISEIFPTRIRGLAMSVATLALWVACFVLTYTFPLLNSSLGSYGTFWIYGIVCVAGYIFISRNLTETKGKSLEQIEEELLQEKPENKK